MPARPLLWSSSARRGSTRARKHCGISRTAFCCGCWWPSSLSVGDAIWFDAGVGQKWRTSLGWRASRAVDDPHPREPLLSERGDSGAEFAIDVAVELEKEIPQRAVARLTSHAEGALDEQVVRVGLPRGRNHSSTPGPSVEPQLGTQLLFAPVVGDEVAHDGVARAAPESAAAALVVAGLVFQGGVSQHGQSVGGDKLSFARRIAFPVPRPAIVPLRGILPQMVDSRREHSLRIRTRRGECLLQVEVTALREGQRLNGLT